MLWKITLQEQAAFDLRSRPRGSVFFVGDDVDDAAVLALAPVSVFVTAGDLPAVQEALVDGVPVLGIPFSAEQLESMNAVARAGAGLLVDGQTFSAHSVRDSVVRLLREERFKAAALHLGQIIQVGGGCSRAADSIEAVAESGATFLLPQRNLQPLYKTYLVDVYLVYSVILCGAFVILRTFLSIVLALFQPLLDDDDDFVDMHVDPDAQLDHHGSGVLVDDHGRTAHSKTA